MNSLSICTISGFHLMSSQWSKAEPGDDGKIYQKRACSMCGAEEWRTVKVIES